MTLTLATVITLVVAGLGLIGVNGRKLISDWPRPKPRHNVDLAWIQVYLGLALLVAAYFLATDPTRVLLEPSPTPIRTDAEATSMSNSKAP